MPGKPRHYDGPPGYVRIHEGHCPRAWTADGECQCWQTAEVVKLPEMPPGATRRKGRGR